MKRKTLALVTALACSCSAAAWAQDQDNAANPAHAQKLEAIEVTGSRIPRAQVEGPAPVVTISAQDIQRNGFATVEDIMTSLTQNLGALDNNQYTGGFSVGAQAVDLRGLGPNHTLVLVNGRRIADWPQSYGGDSNFTDISSIPASMIDRVEILSGSASAIYGSDAISGVINFIMKRHADGTTIDYRVGATEHGGGGSQRLQIFSGWDKGGFSSVFGLELVDKKPLWAYQRSFTDSRQDSPADPSKIYANPTWGILDEDENYIDPGAATCAALASYDKGTTIHAYRRNWGSYCGSYHSTAYGTLENSRKAANFWGSANYRVNGGLELYLDLMASTSHQESYWMPQRWRNCYPLNGDCAPTPFYNAATGRIEQWQREYFTLEENGGFKPGMIRNIDNAMTFNVGVKGTLDDGRWHYDATYGHSQNKLKQKWPALVAARAQALYLGPSLGVDPDSGLQIYDAPHSRFYTPLTVDEFRSITRDSVDNNKSRADTVSATVNTTELFNLPAGPVGFAAVAEYGTQYFGLKADPLSLDGSYYGLHNTSAVGSRSHAGAGAEFSAPLFSMLTLTGAGRYDRYEYGANSSSKFTYAVGLEFRPLESLLLRGSYGTGFRAPDLSYLYAGPSGSNSTGTDYYRCRRDEPGAAPDFIDDCTWGYIGYNGRSHGSTELDNETSRSFTGGIVWSPARGLDFTVDYYNIRLENEVIYQASDQILRQEADCRLGSAIDGTPVDIDSGLCQQVVTQVVRNPATAPISPEKITSVLVLPINAASDRTSGLDFKAHYAFNAGRWGDFGLHLGYTYVIEHKIQMFEGDPFVDELADLYNYVIPRDKANYSVNWSKGAFSATLYGARLGGLPNYVGTERLGPTFMYNASFGYKFDERTNLSFVVDNLFDTKPARDSTWTGYPYYSRNWFNPVGRAYFLEFSYRFGGER